MGDLLGGRLTAKARLPKTEEVRKGKGKSRYKGGIAGLRF